MEFVKSLQLIWSMELTHPLFLVQLRTTDPDGTPIHPNMDIFTKCGLYF